jgi:cobalt-zinc-cadmium efflux system outer membrane protein
VEAGGRTSVDLNRVRLDELKSEQTLREAETTWQVAKANLRSRLGRRDADPNFDVAGSLDAPLTAQPQPVEDAMAAAEQNRSDIISLRLQIEKATKDIETERTKGYPQVTPQFGYTRQFQKKVQGFPDFDTWMTSVTMTLPVHDRNQGNIAKARSVLVQNSFSLNAALAELRAEIVQVVLEFESAYRTTSAVAGEQLKVAAEVRDAINKAYEVGGRTLLEVLDAQRNYRETYRLYISSRANYWRSVYKYQAAIGAR